MNTECTASEIIQLTQLRTEYLLLFDNGLVKTIPSEMGLLSNLGTLSSCIALKETTFVFSLQ